MQSTDYELLTCDMCHFFREGLCTAAEKGTVLRRCLTGLLIDEFASLPAGDLRVLEVGAGTWQLTEQLCESRGFEWIGSEPAEYDSQGNRSNAQIRCAVHSIPLESQSIDYCISSQTVEHWCEFGSSFSSGLAEIWRILKEGGTISLNFPLCFHGHPLFKCGDLNQIAKLFPPFWWERLEIFERLPKNRKGNQRLCRITARKKKNKLAMTSFSLTAYWLINANFALVNPINRWRYSLRRILKGNIIHKQVD
jgi:SAM-dependent methyltransferase